MRTRLVVLFALLVVGSPAGATRFTLLEDEFDDFGLVVKAHDRPEVQAARTKIDEFAMGLWRLKERDFLILFGKPQAMPPKTYAMPVAQPRRLGLSGLRYGDPAMNKDHTDFHVVPGVAGVEVWYQIDGETPAAILLYFPVGPDFPKLTADNLAARLAWDADRLERLKAHVEARLPAVFPWEVDRDELARLESGDFEADARRKLAAWLASGPALGYTCEHAAGSNEWSWYDRDGRLARKAWGSPGRDGDPGVFEWFRPNGAKVREEWFDHPSGRLHTRRWTGSAGNLRYETRDTWCWYGKDGKVVRQEWDDNKDGIPDWYVTAADGIAHLWDHEAMQRRRPLAVPESWAVHPELIPADSQVPDQPGLRVPVRRSTMMAAAPTAEPDAVAMDERPLTPATARWVVLFSIGAALGLAAYFCRLLQGQLRPPAPGSGLNTGTSHRPD